jgi:hypothetical protein
MFEDMFENVFEEMLEEIFEDVFDAILDKLFEEIFKELVGDIVEKDDETFSLLDPEPPLPPPQEASNSTLLKTHSIHKQRLISGGIFFSMQALTELSK